MRFLLYKKVKLVYWNRVHGSEITQHCLLASCSIVKLCIGMIFDRDNGCLLIITVVYIVNISIRIIIPMSLGASVVHLLVGISVARKDRWNLISTISSPVGMVSLLFPARNTAALFSSVSYTVGLHTGWLTVISFCLQLVSLPCWRYAMLQRWNVVKVNILNCHRCTQDFTMEGFTLEDQ